MIVDAQSFFRSIIEVWYALGYWLWRNVVRRGMYGTAQWGSFVLASACAIIALMSVLLILASVVAIPMNVFEYHSVGITTQTLVILLITGLLMIIPTAAGAVRCIRFSDRIDRTKPTVF